MADIGGFLWTVLGGGTLSALLLGIAAMLGKSQLAHWLNKDIEAIKSQHQKALEADKAKYARELETYRTSLIAQAEAIKASQDVKKAMAVKIAEMKFDAVQKLHEAAGGMGVMLAMVEAYRKNGFPIDYGEIAALGGSLHGAATKGKPFLSAAHYGKLIAFSNSYLEGVRKLQNIQSQRDTGDPTAIYSALFAMHGECEAIVSGYMNEMLVMA